MTHKPTVNKLFIHFIFNLVRYFPESTSPINKDTFVYLCAISWGIYTNILESLFNINFVSQLFKNLYLIIDQFNSIRLLIKIESYSVACRL